MRKIKLTLLSFMLLMITLSCREARVSEVFLNPPEQAPVKQISFASFDFLIDDGKYRQQLWTKWQTIFNDYYRLYCRQELTAEPPPHWELIKNLIERFRLFSSFDYDNSLYMKNHLAQSKAKQFLVGRISFQESRVSRVVDERRGGKRVNLLKSETMFKLKVTALLLSSADYRLLKKIEVEAEDNLSEQRLIDVVLTAMVEKAVQRIFNQLSGQRMPEKRYFLR